MIFQCLGYNASEFLARKVIQKEIYCKIPVIYVEEQATTPFEQHFFLQPEK